MEPEPQGPPQGYPHQHDYKYTGGKYTVRHCSCGKSWALLVLESIVDRSIACRWRLIEEEKTVVEP